jgi:hypothetical protein
MCCRALVGRGDGSGGRDSGSGGIGAGSGVDNCRHRLASMPVV